LNQIANAATDEQYVSALNNLQSSTEWQQSTSLHKWFTDTWLKQKVVITLLRSFPIEKLMLDKLVFRSNLSISVITFDIKVSKLQVLITQHVKVIKLQILIRNSVSTITAIALILQFPIQQAHEQVSLSFSVSLK